MHRARDKRMKIIKNIISQKEINDLLDYNSIIDDRSDVRPDVASKHPRWNVDNWPQHIVERILNNVLNYKYEVEEVIFNTSKISFRIHADSGQSDIDRKGHAVLIPLTATGPAHTVFFDNYWNYDSTKFSRVEISPFQYQLPNKNNEWVKIDDIRDFLETLKYNPDTITDFVVDAEFIKEIENLVEARSNNSISKVDNRCYDYSQIENYDGDYEIDADTYNEYLSHIDFESVKGLKIQSVAEWIPTTCFVFPRTQIHCASSCHQEKTGITVFVRPCI
jgi:hypothetical protein